MRAHDLAFPFPVQACAGVRDVMLEDDCGSKLWSASVLSVLPVTVVILYLGGASGQLLRLRSGRTKTEVLGNGTRVIVNAALVDHVRVLPLRCLFPLPSRVAAGSEGWK